MQVDSSNNSNIAIAAIDNSVYCFGEHQSIRSQDEALEDEYQSDNEDVLNDSGGGGGID